MAVAGVLTQDVLPSRGVRNFRLATPLAMAVPLGGSLLVSGMPVADSVAMAFAVSASSFCPLLVLGIWWRRLTPPGVVAGLLLGGGLAFAATVITVSGTVRSGWPHALLAWPAVWSVPVGFLAMILVSLATPGRIPPGTNAAMTRFHLPEALMPGGRAGVSGTGGASGAAVPDGASGVGGAGGAAVPGGTGGGTGRTR